MNIPIAITMGDPAGVGPEILAKAWNRIVSINPAFVVGDVSTMEMAVRDFAPGIEVVGVMPGDEVPTYPGVMPVIQGDEPGDFYWGRPTGKTAMASLSYIDLAVLLVRLGRAGGVVTCPVSKENIVRAGARDFTGHTEFIAGLLHVRRPVMCLVGEKLKVALLTTHIPLRKVPMVITERLIVEVCLICHRALVVDFGVVGPRIAISSLNPHAGEGGVIGDEEIRVFRPALDSLRGAGIDVSGPYPADTIYYRAFEGEFDLVISPYHDQGLAPFKLVHFDDGVNITLGLPIVRTSVDHGTAFGIAGRGVAKEDSLLSAFLWAKVILENRRGSSWQG